jgi:hypothetical protein
VKRFFLVAVLTGLIICAVSVLVRIPFGAKLRSNGGIGPLHELLRETGADLQQVVIAGWVRAARPDARTLVVDDLAWDGTPPAGETRIVTLRHYGDEEYVTLRWTLTGRAISDWERRSAQAMQALARAGGPPRLTVQLEGQTAVTDLLGQADRALRRFGASDHETWSDSFAASVVAYTSKLPPSPFGPNVQIAFRRVEGTEKARVWVAWPALMQEY